MFHRYDLQLDPLQLPHNTTIEQEARGRGRIEVDLRIAKYCNVFLAKRASSSLLIILLPELTPGPESCPARFVAAQFGAKFLLLDQNPAEKRGQQVGVGVGGTVVQEAGRYGCFAREVGVGGGGSLVKIHSRFV